MVVLKVSVVFEIWKIGESEGSFHLVICPFHRSYQHKPNKHRSACPKQANYSEKSVKLCIPFEISISKGSLEKASKLEAMVWNSLLL